MKYMLMMHAPKGKGDWEIFNWPPQDLKADIDFMHRLNKELSGRGRVGRRRGLDRTGSCGQATTVGR
jgi:hypothetical protein